MHKDMKNQPAKQNLKYCKRFYNRQFATRKLEISDILARFQETLTDYFANGLQLMHKTISEVAYDIGLEYPQHFSRMFKK